MMQKKVSVIVPVYNVERYLTRCIESIANQTHKNLEIILIDDGSPDNCGEICDKYSLIDNRIKVIHQANGGLSVARNAGLNVATGDYIIFVDSDDFIEDSLVELCLTCALEQQVDIIMFGWNKIYTDRIVYFKIQDEYNRNLKDAYEGVLYDKIPCYVWNKFYKKSLWNNVRFPLRTNLEDLAVMPFVFSQANSMGYLPKALYNYNRTNVSSIMRRLSSRNKYGLFYSFKIRQEIAIDRNMPDLYSYSRKRALRSAVTAYGLNTQEKVLCQEQLECIQKYVLSEKKDKGLSGIGFKYEILAYGVLGCEAICKFYGSCMFFFEKMRKLINRG